MESNVGMQFNMMANPMMMGVMPAIPVITKDNFVPDNDDIFVTCGKAKQRLIFGEPVEFDKEEMEKVEEFQKYLSDNNLTLPDRYDFREMYRHYQGCWYNAAEAYESIIENDKFISSLLPISKDGLEEYLESGMVYFHKRDKHFRPIWVINVKKLIKTEIDDETLMKLTVYVVSHVVGKPPNFNFSIEKGMRSGAIENWVVILDCKDVGVTEVPKKKLQTMVGQLQKNFRGRLYRLYAINMPFMLRALWKLVKGMWDKFTQEKMKVYGGGFEKDLLELVPADHLEERFGGNIQDKKDNYFPPELD